MAKEVVVNPGASLPSRPGDIYLSDEQYLKLALFAKLKQKPSVKKFPGALVLRRYRPIPGDDASSVIYLQGDAGWTAFYVLTSEDVLMVREAELAAGELEPGRSAALEREIAELRERIEQVKQPNQREVGHVNVAISRKRGLKPASVLRPRRRSFEGPIKNVLQQTVYLPRDASFSLDYERLREPLFEGEVFGEVSCLNRVPRGETVVATRECYVLEMLRNILDMLKKDKAYNLESEQSYKKNTLQIQMRKISLFAELSDEQFEGILPELDLASFEPGQIVYDEHESSQDVYVIRTGLVRVMKNVSSLLRNSHVSSGKARCAALLQGEKTAPAPAAAEKKAPPAAAEKKVPPAAAEKKTPPVAEEKKAAPAAAEEKKAVPSAAEKKTPPAAADEKKAPPAAEEKKAAPAAAAEKKAPPAAEEKKPAPPAAEKKTPPAPAEKPVPAAAAEKKAPPAAAEKPAPAPAAEKKPPSPEEKKAAVQGKVWQLLPEPARQAVRTAAAAVGLINTAEVVLALNELIKAKPFAESKEVKEFLTDPSLRERLSELPANLKDWSDQDVRKCNRSVLEALYPDGLGTAEQGEGLSCTLTHHSPGEFFGGQGVGARQGRDSTCIADGHPTQDGLVELVRIPGPTFLKLLEMSPAVKKKVDEEALERKKQTRERLQVPVWDDSRQVQLSETFQELGLIQGQKLMLIDLDRCTRCDECVKACVNTHDDGRSRLFLDGPRFGRFLVPLTCRSCLDPVCLTTCPVGSIHRGDDRQIIIENWCIGCGQCGDNCPYGSIQMHDVGVIAENARGWRFLPASLVSGDGWKLQRFKDKHWLRAMGPILYDREFKETMIRGLKGQAPPELVSLEPTYCFRYEFDLEKDRAQPTTRFTLKASSAAKELKVWVNGREAKPDQEKRGTREYYLAGGEAPRPGRWWWRRAGSAPEKEGAEPAAPPPVFCKGRNVLAVQVTGKPATGEKLMQLRLDEVKKPTIPEAIGKDLEEEVTEKLVVEKAVVCDLCATLPQGPACVTACPHEAAMRVNARSNFPNK